jgi:hypothetical protein
MLCALVSSHKSFGDSIIEQLKEWEAIHLRAIRSVFFYGSQVIRNGLRLIVDWACFFMPGYLTQKSVALEAPLFQTIDSRVREND